MEVFNLPNRCKIDKNIPKEIIYKNAEANEKLKRVFIDNVEKIRFMYLLNFSNSNIQSYINDKERFEEIDFIKIILKEKGKEHIISKLFHQLIPKSTVIILELKNEILISTSDKRTDKEKIILEEVFNSNWIDIENKMLKELEYKKLNSTNLKLFYDDITEKVRVINLSKKLNCENSIESENIDLLEKLNKEIEELKVLRKKETQINRVAEIQTKLLKKIEESNNNIEVYKVDVRNKEELKSAIDDFSKGNLDLIINSAGIYTNNRTAKLTDKEAYAMIDINLTGVLNTFEAVRNMMFKNNRGHIAVISSIAGLLDYPKASVYARTKMTIIGVCETYRAFFRDYNINITIIIPGYIATDKLKSLSEEDVSKKPTVLSEEEATNITIKAIEEKKEKIIYPLSMKILISIITKLPKRLLTYILMKQANWGKK